MIRHSSQLQYVNGEPKTIYRRRAMPRPSSPSEMPHFTKLASDLAADLWNTIIVNKPFHRSHGATRDRIVQLLEEHITQNMVKIGGHYYRQRVGIPQGSILSTMLCSFFYGDLERKDERIMRLRNDPGSVRFACPIRRTVVANDNPLWPAATPPCRRLPLHHDECTQSAVLLRCHEPGSSGVRVLHWKG
jgi:hypothetical protein